jgi:hypothetical protein
VIRSFAAPICADWSFSSAAITSSRGVTHASIDSRIALLIKLRIIVAILPALPVVSTKGLPVGFVIIGTIITSPAHKGSPTSAFRFVKEADRLFAWIDVGPSDPTEQDRVLMLQGAIEPV